ncbi:hypothetical protein EJ357_00785 [Streptomyces cyaneochromogenes]|uniref:Uncharacterized protein n=1 Tax=Streptomyces cyaneochromogenes TaxID=2496836 RepID=A0A3Q9ENQ8_9ACTN|nr:hypothetical protein [Streptomyces cyaneochromogenes]AZQ32189.1 hypothetical protein EJ357_00785 [Streptomyces cyaneochromogenes]
MVIGGVTGSLKDQLTLLLGRYDEAGGLRMVARATPVTTAVRRDVGQRLTPTESERPWHGRYFSAGWGCRDIDGEVRGSGRNFVTVTIA